MIYSVINPVFLELGPIQIRWYAILIVSGALLATVLSNNEAQRKGLPKDYIFDLLFYLLPIGIIGARIYYVLFKLEDYQNNWLNVFKIWEGGLAIYGGLLAGLGVIYWYSKKFKVPMLLTLDIITPGVLLAQAIGRWGNFINQEAHGDMVSRSFLESLHLPNWIIEQMNINGIYYHPTFLYESVASLLGFIVLFMLRRYVKQLKIGDITLAYIIWYGIERFFIEGMRTDSLWIGPLRVSQALSLILVVVAIGLFIYLHNHSKQFYALYRYNEGENLNE